MEWAQVLAIVIPIVFTIVVGIFYNNRQLGLTNKRIDDLRLDMDKRFAALDGRFVELKTDMNSQFGELKADTDRRFTELKADMDGRFSELEADTDRRFTEVHDELKEIKADIREIRQFFLRLIPIPEPPKENP